MLLLWLSEPASFHYSVWLPSLRLVDRTAGILCLKTTQKQCVYYVVVAHTDKPPSSHWSHSLLIPFWTQSLSYHEGRVYGGAGGLGLTVFQVMHIAHIHRRANLG